jgi:small-conductance mechanosensitive channel
MSLFGDILETGRSLLPVLAAIAIVGAALATINYVLSRQFGGHPRARFRIQVVMLVLTLVGLLAVILVISRNDPEMRGQLLGFIGILLSATIALSSTTFLGNSLAGVLLRVVASFRTGDFISVGDNFGRVSERSLLHTEIQTEDRDLTTLPNLYLVTNPVRVVRPSGTIVSATVSLGYDVPRTTVEGALIDAAARVGLEDPFVHILELGDFSVTYRIAGLLTEVKHLLSRRSALRAAVLDTLHGNGIEIVSPSFMTTRALERGAMILPPESRVASQSTDEGTRSPEAVVFDKADEAERTEDLTARRKQLAEHIQEMRERAAAETEESARSATLGRVEQLEAVHEEIGKVIERALAKAGDE